MRRTKAQARSPQAGAPADQPRIREGVVRGGKGASCNLCRSAAGEAGDAMNMGGFDGFGQAHRRQDGGRSAR
jgi:hypothetical protein